MSIEESVRAVRAPEGSGVRRIGIAMNGVTGRMGANQHLIRSILAIRAQGGVEVGREVIWPEPVLIGRDERKLARLAAAHGLERWSTDLDACLADPELEVYFDAQVTQRRPDAIRSGDRRRQGRLLREAGRPRRWPRGSSSRGSPATPASATASSRTSSSCPACSSSAS